MHFHRSMVSRRGLGYLLEVRPRKMRTELDKSRHCDTVYSTFKPSESEYLVDLPPHESAYPVLFESYDPRWIEQNSIWSSTPFLPLEWTNRFLGSRESAQKIGIAFQTTSDAAAALEIWDFLWATLFTWLAATLVTRRIRAIRGNSTCGGFQPV